MPRSVSRVGVAAAELQGLAARVVNGGITEDDAMAEVRRILGAYPQTRDSPRSTGRCMSS